MTKYDKRKEMEYLFVVVVDDNPPTASGRVVFDYTRLIFYATHVILFDIENKKSCWVVYKVSK